MKQLLVPILLVANLGLTSTLLALAMTGRLVAATAAAPGEEAVEVVENKPTFYYEFTPELVVNFPGDGAPRYMQLSITAVTADEAALAALELHSPAIRNDLLLLFSGLESAPLASREGKEGMRQQALDTIRGIMQARYGSAAVDDVYFTRFVMQ